MVWGLGFGVAALVVTEVASKAHAPPSLTGQNQNL